MTGYVLSPHARADLSGIWDYTADHWGIDQADHYVREIATACSELARGRRQSRPIDDIRPGYAKLLVGAHVLFFRRNDIGQSEVVRILHQRMDFAR